MFSCHLRYGGDSSASTALGWRKSQDNGRTRLPGTTTCGKGDCTGRIIEAFRAAGLKQPDISILSDQFLCEVRGLKYKNVAVELLEKLFRRQNPGAFETKPRPKPEFSERLKKTLNAYDNRAIATQ